MRRFLALACALGLFLAPAAAQIIPPPPVYNAPGGAPALDAYQQVTRNALSYAEPQLVPVCNTEFNTEGGLSATGQDFDVSYTLRCPRGAKSIKILLPGFYLAPAETSLNYPLSINIGIWANSPAPFVSGTTYHSGDIVAYGSDPGNAVAFWQANTTTTQTPVQTATDWAAYTPATTLFKPVTCNGGRACQVMSQVQPDGTVIAQAVASTDLVGAAIPVNGHLYLKLFGVQFGSQITGVGAPVQPRRSEYTSYAQPKTDYSLANPTSSTYGGAVAGYRPLGVIGIPLQSGPTACLLGHSIESGAAGSGFATPTLTNGGSGYTTADIGVPFVIPNTGAGTYATSNSAQYLIKTISAGVVTAIYPWFRGQYNNTSFDAGGGAPPSGAQTIVDAVLHGSGLILTLATVSSGFDYGDDEGYRGVLARAADAANIPFATITASSDTSGNLITRSYSRRAAISALGCSTVVNDYAINDIGVVATGEANTLALAAMEYTLPFVKAVVFLTSGPSATSTDGFASTVNQTGINTTKIQQFNTWLRTQASAAGPITGVIDPWTVVSSSLDSGLFLPSGSSSCGRVTPEGIHYTTCGYQLLGAQAATLLSGVVQ